MKKIIFVTEKMDEAWVDLLYANEPDLNDPYFPKEVLYIDGEIVTLLITVNDVQYICISNPRDRNTWYHVITTQEA